MIVRCDAVEYYMFLTVSQLEHMVGLSYGEVVYNLHIPRRCKVGRTDSLQHNGIINSETDMCM